MKPEISIIIPTFNRCSFLGETLDSIVNQTFQDWECILIDDRSTDYTEELMDFYCEKDSRIRYHHRPDRLPKGANACRNHGFDLSGGEFINWFDSDDLMMPELLEEKIEIFKRSPEIDFVVSSFSTFKEGEKIKDYLVKDYENYLYGYLFNEISLNALNILWRKAAIGSNRWDEALFKYQDLAFLFDVLTKPTLKGRSLNSNKIKVRLHPERISARNDWHNVSSKIKVRSSMYKSAIKTRMEFRVVHAIYHQYLFEVRNALSSGHFGLFVKELKDGNIQDRFTTTKLFFYGLLFKFGNRGLGAITKLLLKHSKKMESKNSWI